MISLGEARSLAAKRLGARLTKWALEPPDEPAFSLGLKPPTERAALGDQATAQEWAKEWHDASLPSGVIVDQEIRNWHRIGRQLVPVNLRLTTSAAVADFVQGAVGQDWRTFSVRVAEIRARLGTKGAVDDAIRRHAKEILSWSPERFEQVLAAVTWLTENPVDGLRPRQMPIRGVDTKWFAAHRSAVTDLYRASTGRESLGLVNNDPLVRLRLLDPEMSGAGPTDFAAPVDIVASLRITPEIVFVFENLESVLAMPPFPGAVVVHGSGHAIDVVTRIDWVMNSPVIYWGDLDSHGMAILHRLRRHHPRVTSVLMDETTLLNHRDLWVVDPKPNRGVFDTLTDGEATALVRLREHGDVRLEQERIPWSTSLQQLQLTRAARSED